MAEDNDFKAAREEKQRQNAWNLQLNSADVLDLEGFGFNVEKINDYQYRISERHNPAVKIDLYPTNRKYHVLKPEDRGTYDDAKTFLESKFKELAAGKTELTDESEMPFGVHSGKKMEDVPADYLLYLHSTGKYSKAVREYIITNLDVLRKQADEQPKTYGK